MPRMEADVLKRILIVDDEPDVTELLDYKFKQAGYAVRTLNDPLRAVGLARDFRPTIVPSPDPKGGVVG